MLFLRVFFFTIYQRSK